MKNILTTLSLVILITASLVLFQSTISAQEPFHAFMPLAGDNTGSFSILRVREEIMQPRKSNERNNLFVSGAFLEWDNLGWDYYVVRFRNPGSDGWCYGTPASIENGEQVPYSYAKTARSFSMRSAIYLYNIYSCGTFAGYNTVLEFQLTDHILGKEANFSEIVTYDVSTLWPIGDVIWDDQPVITAYTTGYEAPGAVLFRWSSIGRTLNGGIFVAGQRLPGYNHGEDHRSMLVDGYSPGDVIIFQFSMCRPEPCEVIVTF